MSCFVIEYKENNSVESIKNHINSIANVSLFRL
jgi:hypothetical protein